MRDVGGEREEEALDRVRFAVVNPEREKSKDKEDGLKYHHYLLFGRSGITVSATDSVPCLQALQQSVSVK